jgi:hypothetical protein
MGMSRIKHPMDVKIIAHQIVFLRPPGRELIHTASGKQRIPNTGPQFISMSVVALSIPGPKYAFNVSCCNDEKVIQLKH